MNEKRYKILLKSHHGIHKNGKIIAVGRDTILSEDEEKYYISRLMLMNLRNFPSVICSQ